jgi:hypothetical protein
MRPLFAAALGLAFALTQATAAPAGTLLWSGTLTLELPAVYFPAVFTGQGVATGSGAGFVLSSGAFSGTTVVPTRTPFGAPITGNLHVLSGNGPGSFSGSPLGGTMSLAGHIDVIAFGGLEILEVRLSGTGGAVGVPGTFTYTDPNFGGLWTVSANAWTTARISFPPVSTTSGVITARTGFDARNAKGVGVTRLVTSFRAQTAIGLVTDLGLVTLDLTFVPEPSGLGAAALGIALFAAVAGSRRRARG